MHGGRWQCFSAALSDVIARRKSAQRGFDTLAACAYRIFKGGAIKEYEVSPQDFGFPIATHDDIRGGSPEENALALRQLLEGQESAYRNAVILNAAAGIYTAGKSDSLGDAVKLATTSIDSGAALEKLTQLAQITNPN